MDAESFERITSQFLISFKVEKLTTFHILHMDNAPSHTADKTPFFSEPFWREKVTVEYSNSKINHLQKVLRKIIQYNRKATGL